MDNEKIVCHTPTPGKKPTRIDKWKYDLIAKAILKTIPKTGQGFPFRDLSARVERALPKADAGRIGSVAWYTVVVKLDLEVRGKITRVQDKGPQRLLQVSQ